MTQGQDHGAEEAERRGVVVKRQGKKFQGYALIFQVCVNTVSLDGLFDKSSEQRNSDPDHPVIL